MSFNTTREEQIIIDCIKTFGCMSVEQIKTLLYDEESHVNIASTVKFLALQQVIDIVDKNYLIPFIRGKVNKDIIDCIWVAMNHFVDEETGLIDIDGLLQSFKGEAPIQLTSIKDDVIINFICIDSKGLNNVAFVRDRFYAKTKTKLGEEDKSDVFHIFITRDESVIDKITEFELAIPHCIVLLSGERTARPEITYYTAEEEDEEE